MKAKVIMPLLASVMMLGSIVTVNAQDLDKNETDPNKVFPIEQVDDLRNEAN